MKLKVPWSYSAFGCLILVLLALGPLLFSEPFFDDWVFIFNPDLANEIQNPLQHFNPAEKHFRAWPLSHTLYFGYRYFGHAYSPLYFLINILLHLCNAFLFFRILRSEKMPGLKVTTLLFLFSPAAVFTTGQLVQLNALFATCFFLMSLLILSLKKNASTWQAVAICLMGISFLFKPVFVLLAVPAFAYILIFKNRRLHSSGFSLPKGTRFAMVAVLLLTLYSVWVTRRGVDTYRGESEFSSGFERNGNLGQTELASDIRRIETVTPDPTVLMSADVLLSEEDERLSHFEKAILIFSNLGFYISHQFYFWNAEYVYSKRSSTPHLVIGFVSTITMLIFWVGFWLKPRTRRAFRIGVFAMVSTFVPISGLYYVPYMKFSLVSHHWWYASTLGFAVVFGLLLHNCILFFSRFSPKTALAFRFVFVTLMVLQTYALSSRFESREFFLKENLAAVPESNLLRRLLAQQLASNSKIDEALEILKEAALRNPYDNMVRVQMAEIERMQLNGRETERSPASESK